MFIYSRVNDQTDASLLNCYLCETARLPAVMVGETFVVM